MSLDRALQFHTAALAVLGAIFVALGHENPVVPAALALAAIASVCVTDLLGWIRLNRPLANLIAIVAVVLSLRGFFEKDSERQLMAIANMLCYLQMVLLFQEKATRVHWQLVVLSVLEVVVAAALDLGPQFGIVLGFYSVVALSTLILLCIDRASQPDSASSAGTTRPPGTMPSLPKSVRGAPTWKILLAAPEVLPPTPRGDDFRASLRLPMVARQTALLAAATFLFGTVFFYATPRLNDDAWMGRQARAGVSGFPPEIRLKQKGRIHLSSQVVMRVALTKAADRRPVLLVGEPYFHGAILNEYVRDEQGSRWTTWQSPYGGRRRGGLFFSTPQTSRSLVRQDIVLEANASNRAFAIMPIQQVGELPEGLRFSSLAGRNDRQGGGMGRQQRYALLTPAIVGDRQVHAIPHTNPRHTDDDNARLETELYDAAVFDEAAFPRLSETAAAVLREQDLTHGKWIDKAHALERHFHTPGLYAYSLNLDVPRATGVDPIEDFVANHRTGHCEYFASALALMLRSQGIPSRVVIGYKGGTLNSLGRYYVVQQLHAHAWVEAWLPPGDVPRWDLAGLPSESGAWYRLDPTPGREEVLAERAEGVGDRVAQVFDYVELLWRDYVLSLNKNRQEDIVYEPLTEKAAVVPSWVESNRLRRWLRNTARRLKLDLDFAFPGERRGRHAFEGWLALLVIGGLIVLLLLLQGARMAFRLARRWLGRADTHAVPRSHAPAFYIRLERLLAQLPLVRQPGQTPQELAAEAARRLHAGRATPAADLPAGVVAAYYRVRFGGGHLDKTETEAIEQALCALAPAVSQARKQ